MVNLIALLVIRQHLIRDIAFLCPVLYDNALFVDGCPVFYLVLKFIDDISRIIRKVLYNPSVQPAAVFFHKRPGQIVMI